MSNVSSINVNVLKDNLNRFLGGLNTIIEESPKSVGRFDIDEIEIHAQIDNSRKYWFRWIWWH